ncbi:MAG: hypothetical protein ACJA1A_001232 [Saprospiraceae bacterium]|jgi:hypothetical protein|tara:strand:+ start:2680 stop:4317 length:1638 start_codon:yes stop_codon:yes gene_type:complete
MQRRMPKIILTLITITLFFSCGEDVIGIKDTPIPNEPQEIFEVNVVGYSTDSEHNFLENVDLTINGNLLNTDSTSFFVENKILIGKEGSVIKAQKAGYLPVYKRVYHHRSLEDVVANISMHESPIAQEVSSEGGDVLSDSGSVLSFDENVFSQSSDVTFYASFDEENQVDVDPFIVSENEIRMLDDQVLFYLGSSEGISQGGKVSILFSANNVSNIEDLDVYRYDESLLTWTVANNSLKEVDGMIVVDIDSFGWWALGTANETVYATLTVKQRDASFIGITSLRNAEIVFSKIENRNSNEHVFTDNNGDISKYYPIALNQEISINNGVNTEHIDLVFDHGIREQIVQSNVFVLDPISAKVFDCQLNKQSGFVTILKGDQYVIKRIDSGNVEFSVNTNDEILEFRFYDFEEKLLLTRLIETEKLTGESVDFVACEPVLSVETEAVVLQNFDQCKLRVKPIESFIVGESSDNTQFFIAFKGDEVGVYDGLVYYAGETLSFTVADIEKEVKVDIMIYDKISSTTAGFVDGKYKSGEEYKISFIGNIEE